MEVRYFEVYFKLAHCRKSAMDRGADWFIAENLQWMAQQIGSLQKICNGGQSKLTHCRKTAMGILEPHSIDLILLVKLISYLICFSIASISCKIGVRVRLQVR